MKREWCEKTRVRLGDEDTFSKPPRLVRCAKCKKRFEPTVRNTCCTGSRELCPGGMFDVYLPPHKKVVKARLVQKKNISLTRKRTRRDTVAGH